MRLSIIAVLFFTFCNALSAQFWTDVKLEWIKWSNDCNLHDTCIQPTVQLRLINIFNNETISKTLKVNFDKQQQTSGTQLITYWNEGIPDMIVSTITINGIDPDYDFPRLCDSTGTIFLFLLPKVNMTEMSGMCFKAQLTFTKYSDQCSYVTSPMTDHIDKNTSQIFLTVVIGCLITCFMLICIFITINRFLKMGSKSNTQIKRTSISKSSVSNACSFNVEENSCESVVRSRVLPINFKSGNLDLMKFRNVFTAKPALSANSSFCGSI